METLHALMIWQGSLGSPLPLEAVPSLGGVALCVMASIGAASLLEVVGRFSLGRS